MKRMYLQPSKKSLLPGIKNAVSLICVCVCLSGHPPPIQYTIRMEKLEEMVLGVLGGRRISLRVKGKYSPLYMTVVRQAMMYDAGTCAVKKA